MIVFSVCLFCYTIFIVTLLRYVSNELKELLTYLLTYHRRARPMTEVAFNKLTFDTPVTGIRVWLRLKLHWFDLLWICCVDLLRNSCTASRTSGVEPNGFTLLQLLLHKAHNLF